jgi:hypothetical protein
MVRTMSRMRAAIASILLIPSIALAEDKPPEQKPDADTPWFEKLSIRGYLQTRYNRLYASDPDFKNDLGDRALADDNTFSIRRARLVVSGEVAPFLSIYLQTDAAGVQVAMRDWYGDIFLDGDKTLRLRVGQSKVPYGWENLQSSQNRAPLDRSDAVNSGLPGERDIGVFAYWAPVKARKMFKYLVDSGLKGSGDYGVVGVGLYSGQLLNQTDKNGRPHVVARVTYPIQLPCKQILEIGGGGYAGRFVVTKEADTTETNNFRDQRAIASVAFYPQPIGFFAEYTVGRGPEFDTTTGTVQTKGLHGFYAMVIAHVGDFFPFVRGTLYDGGLKGTTDAPRSETRELAIGTEWQYKKRLELTAELDIGNRELNDIGACENGDVENHCVEAVFRLQAQLNY